VDHNKYSLEYLLSQAKLKETKRLSRKRKALGEEEENESETSDAEFAGTVDQLFKDSEDDEEEIAELF
jgi:hypothetical protein